MRKVKAISLIVFGFFLAYGSFQFFEPNTNLDKKILDIAISDSISIVGFRNNTGNATVSYRYNYYITSKVDVKALSSPFLISDTQNIEVNIKGLRNISVAVSGKVYEFTNIIWVKNGESLVPIEMEFTANNIEHL